MKAQKIDKDQGNPQSDILTPYPTNTISEESNEKELILPNA